MPRGKNVTLWYLRRIRGDVNKTRIELQRGFAEMDEEIHEHAQEIAGLRVSRDDHERRLRRLERDPSKLRQRKRRPSR